MAKWIGIYLAEATKRIQKQIEGIELSTRDAFNVSTTLFF